MEPILNWLYLVLNLRTKFRSYESATSATGTFRAGKGTLDLYLEGENHLYNTTPIQIVKFFRVHDRKPEISRALPAAPFDPVVIFIGG